MDKRTGNGIEGLFLTYKDVKLATEVVGDLTEQVVPLVPHGEVAEPPGPCLPLLEVLPKLCLLPGPRVHGSLDPSAASFSATAHLREHKHTHKLACEGVAAALVEWRSESVRGKSYLMQRVPPVMRAVLPCSAHFTGAPIAVPVNICSGNLSASPGPVCVATGLSMSVLDR
jgi:hypothetical protein